MGEDIKMVLLFQYADVSASSDSDLQRIIFGGVKEILKMGIFRERRTSLPTMAIKDNSETTKDVNSKWDQDNEHI